MEDEKMLPLGEPTLHFPPPEKPVTALPDVVKSAPEPATPPSFPGVPSQKQQQWGVLISIVIIVLMITIGAFYAWGQRISQERALLAPAAAQ
jgi:hypothetical protein